jgi:hypothetical protein
MMQELKRKRNVSFEGRSKVWVGWETSAIGGALGWRGLLLRTQTGALQISDMRAGLIERGIEDGQ